jgi:hypothetical protein
MKIIELRRKQLKKAPEDGKTSHVHGLTELILLIWLYYQKQSTDSMKFS